MEPLMFRSTLHRSTASDTSSLARWTVLALLALPMAAVAGELGVKVEPGVAFPLTASQSDRFDMGGGIPVKLLYGIGPYLDVTAGVSMLGLPRSSSSLASEYGTAWGYGAGLRLKTARDSQAFYGMSPWVDADALYVRTGPLNRFGFAAGTGLAFPLGEQRNLWLGPFVRYQHVVGRGEGAADGRDAKVLLAGLSFEFGTSPMRREHVAQQAAPAPVAATAAVAVAAPERPSDRDRDGTPDKDDLCPDVAASAANHGCPVYAKVVVKPDKLELNEKIQFDRDSPRIEPASLAALDEVVKALQDNRGFRVQLEGHASSEGEDEHNQTLSEGRAQAVLDYLVGHGVAAERLVSKGFSSSVPTESNTTAAGREANRRVEFVVNFIILNPESGK
jgi:outer membrane protein OmpA-like peptidoglycan-associated protein